MASDKNITLGSCNYADAKGLLEEFIGCKLPEPTTFTPEQEEKRQRSWVRSTNGLQNGTKEGPSQSQLEWWKREKHRHRTSGLIWDAIMELQPRNEDDWIYARDPDPAKATKLLEEALEALERLEQEIY